MYIKYVYTYKIRYWYIFLLTSSHIPRPITLIIAKVTIHVYL